MQDEEDEDEDNEEEGGLSKSGKELKKLLGRASGMNESDAEDDDDDDEVWTLKFPPFPSILVYVQSLFSVPLITIRLSWCILQCICGELQIAFACAADL